MVDRSAVEIVFQRLDALTWLMHAFLLVVMRRSRSYVGYIHTIRIMAHMGLCNSLRAVPYTYRLCAVYK